MLQYKGYTAHVEYDDSIDEFVGTTVDMKDVLSFGGKTTDELKASFHIVVDEYLKMCADDGVAPEKPYQGNISLRIAPGLHKKVDIAATSHGVSINAFIESAIKSRLGIPTRATARKAATGRIIAAKRSGKTIRKVTKPVRK